MRVEHIMEMPEKYFSAYQYYKKHLKDDDTGMTPIAKLAKVARMYMIPNVRHFEKYVDEMESSGGANFY